MAATGKKILGNLQNMDVDLNIARFDPESDEKKPYRQEFNIEVDEDQ